MATKKKPSEAEVPPAHDPALHEAVGRPNDAVRGCPACDDNVREGLAVYAKPGDRGGMAMVPRSRFEPDPQTSPVEVLEGKDDVLAAVLKAAETLQPGLAEILAPIAAYGLEQMAVQGAEDLAFKAWQSHVDDELAAIRADLRQGISAVHANVVELIRRLFDEKGQPRIRKVE